MIQAEAALRLDASWVDYSLVALYFAFVLGIGWAARSKVSSSIDFFLSGRSLPAWVTGLAFISANLGAVEIVGMSANGVQYGFQTMHYFWIGAIPAMVFLGIVMMPFYYGSKVRSVPEFMLRRFGPGAHLVNALSFAVAQLLIAGINLLLLAKVVNSLLGWPLWVTLIVAAVIVLSYITLGGLSAAIYNEVLQFFVIIAALLPLTLIGLHNVGGWSGLKARCREPTYTWPAPTSRLRQPDRSVIGLTFGPASCCSSATDHQLCRGPALDGRRLKSAARRLIIGAFPKMFVPFIVVIPGMIAAATVTPIMNQSAAPNDAILYLMRDLLPNGLLGVAIAGLLAAFMAGMAANISAFNTVISYDICQAYLIKDRDDDFYLKFGRWATVAAAGIAVFTALIANNFGNVMDYLQTLFGFFNAPLFATFILGMFWKRMTLTAGCRPGASTLSAIAYWYVSTFTGAEAAVQPGPGHRAVAASVISWWTSLLHRGLAGHEAEARP